MRMYKDTEAGMRERALQEVREYAYNSICPDMNRKERRTAKGKMLVAQAEAASLKAELEFLKKEIEQSHGY